MTSDLEDDELGLCYFVLLSYDVFAETALHPGVQGLFSVLEMLRVPHIT